MIRGAAGFEDERTGQTRLRTNTVLIAGLGSPHGDDQVGWAVIDRIRPGLPVGMSAHKLSSPLDLLDRMAGCDRLIVIDASAPSGQPGSVRRFLWPCPGLADSAFISTHGVGLVAALRLAERLGDLPQRVTIFAIEAGAIGPALPLTAAARHGLEVVAEAIGQELAEFAL
jgi:hydrogenase maturation protease